MKKKQIVSILFIIALIVVVGFQTYSYYCARMNVSVSSTTANIICDAEIETVSNDEKSIYGYSEFKVKVKNHDSSTVSGVPFSYSITFENVSGSSAIFGYNNVFDADLTINGSINNDQSRDNYHIIQVKSTNGLSESINYKVNLNCTQN